MSLTDTIDVSRRIEKLEADAALVEWFFSQCRSRIVINGTGGVNLVHEFGNKSPSLIKGSNADGTWPTYLAAIRKAKEMSDD